MRFWRPSCAEFPNDNPETHDGVTWRCSWTRACASAVWPEGGSPEEQPQVRFPFPTGAEVRARLRAGALRMDFAGSALDELSAPTPAPMPVSDGGPSAKAVWRPSVAEIDPFIQELQALVGPLSAPAPESPALAASVAGGQAPERAPTAAPPVRSASAPAPTAAAPVPSAPTAAAPTPSAPPDSASLSPSRGPESDVSGTDAVGAPPGWTEVREREPEPQVLAVALERDEAPSLAFRVPRPDAVLSPLTHLTATAATATLDLDLTPPPPGLDGWADLVTKLRDFLLVGGATRAAALLPGLLEGERVDLSRLGPRVARALSTAGIASGDGPKLRPTVKFQAAVVALRESFINGGGNAAAGRALCVSLIEALLASSAGREAIESHLRKAGLDSLLHRAA